MSEQPLEDWTGVEVVQGFKYFHAIETLSRRKAEVSAEIAKANQKRIELEHAITLLQREQLNPAQYPDILAQATAVCSICSGAGCSTCLTNEERARQLLREADKAEEEYMRKQYESRTLPELIRCKDCGDTAAFLTEGRCSTCHKNPRPKSKPRRGPTSASVTPG